MIQHINIVALLVVAFVVVAVLSGPLLLITFGLRAARRGTARGRVIVGIGTALLLLVLTPLAYYLAFSGPWHRCIVTQGTAPSGQEYCVLQTFQNWAEPYQISFYIRDTNGLWRWYYLDHEGYAWRTASASFSGDQVTVFRNGKPYLTMPMPTGTVDLATVQEGYQNYYCPVDFTVADILERQRSETR